MSTLRMLKYHDCSDKDFGPDYFRAGAHADFDVLTLLFQREGQDGLELCPGRKLSTEFGYGDEWTPIKVERGAIVINVGDQLMRWSDDRLKRCVVASVVSAARKGMQTDLPLLLQYFPPRPLPSRGRIQGPAVLDRFLQPSDARRRHSRSEQGLPQDREHPKLFQRTPARRGRN